MNILNKVTWQSLKKNRTRTIVTIIGVILSAAMITAVTTFGVSLLNYLAKGAAQKYGDWDVEFSSVDSSFASQRAHDAETLKTVSFENIGYAQIGEGENTNTPYFFIAGFNQKTFDRLPVTLISGRLPKNDDEIIISGSTLKNENRKYAVGDTLTLNLGSRQKGEKILGQDDPYEAKGETFLPKEEKTYRVVGILKTPAFEKEKTPGYTVITKVKEISPAKNISLFVTLKNPQKIHSYVNRVAGANAYSFNNNVLRFMGLSDDTFDRWLNALLLSIGGIVIAIIMLGSVFLIYNSFNISLNERTHQFGILLSVGATPKQLRNSVLFEGICIGAVGIPIGIFAGIFSIGLVISVVAKNFNSILYSNVPLTLVISPLAIVAAAFISILTILISAYIPARKAANTPVMECIRQTNEIKVESKAVKTSKLARRIYGLEGTLALKNFKRNKKCYCSIVLSLVLSIVLFISTSAFVGNLTQISSESKNVTDYDIGFGTQEMDDRDMIALYQKLIIAAELSKSSYQTNLNYTAVVKTADLTPAYWQSIGKTASTETVNLPLTIRFLDDISYKKIIKDLGLSPKEYIGKNEKVIAISKMQNNSDEVNGVEDLPDMLKATSTKFTIMPKVNGKTKEDMPQNISVTSIAMLPPDTPPVMAKADQKPYCFQVIAPYSLKEKLAPSGVSIDTRVKGCTFQSKNPSKTASEMESIIQKEKVESSYLFLNSAKSLEESRNYAFIANVFAYIFIIMMSLIAVTNVFNTISTNIKLRKRELAMLRSVGMADCDFNKMMRFECAFYGMRALLFGLPIAIICSWLIYEVMYIGDTNRIAFTLPWSSIGISICSVILVIFITMMYAVRTIKKENIIDALRDDML